MKYYASGARPRFRSCGIRAIEFRNLFICLVVLGSISSFQLAFSSERSDKLDRIEELIERGEIADASRMLSELSQVSHRSPREMAIRARMEPIGARSIEFLHAALTGSERPRERERIYLLQARYYQAHGKWDSLGMVLREYDREFSRGELRFEFARISVFVSERSGDIAGAEKLVSSISRSASSSDVREWAALMLARYQMLKRPERSAGRRKLNRLASSSGSQMAPLALYLMSRDNISAKDFDNAALNFSILREAYPDAIGADDLIDAISALDETSGSGNGEAEKMLGALYSIQVGVFSVKENANRQKKRFAGYDKNIEVRRKKISGKNYYAVYVGRFRSATDAEALKKTLEQSEKELYSIVLRDG